MNERAMLEGARAWPWRWLMADWKKICCAIDFSDQSRFAMGEAADLSRRFAAELALLHVWEVHAVSSEILLSKFERAGARLEEDMRRFASEAQRMVGRAVRTVILAGTAAPEIVRFARGGSFDLVVMATHSRTGLLPDSRGNARPSRRPSGRLRRAAAASAWKVRVRSRISAA